MQIDIFGRANRDICDAINACWYRLPRHIQQQLDHVKFTYRATSSGGRAYKAYASAGRADIDIYELPPMTAAAVGIIAHECAHVALRHAQLLNAGAITVEQAERQADDLLHQWGFTSELASRRLFIGR